MSSSNLLIGPHVSIAKDISLAPVRAHELGATGFAIFTKNQKVWSAPALEDSSIRAFKEKLESTFNVDVVMQDERLSTKEAEYYMLEADVSRKKRKQKIDSLAATIILQTYLDKERNEKI